MSENRADFWTLTTDTGFYRYLFACGCEFLTRGEADLVLDMPDVTCIVHKRGWIALFGLDEDGYWQILDGSLTMPPSWHEIPPSRGVHPNSADWIQRYRAAADAEAASKPTK